MIRLDARGLPEIQRMLRNLAAEQIPYAVSSALNSTAFKVKDALQSEMKSVFDRPTPWLIRQVAVAKATKESLTAIVGTPEGIKNEYGKGVGFSHATSSGAFERYIGPHINGGDRLPRSAEVRLRKVGLLPPGWFVVPAHDAPLDAYGNLSGPWWMMILSWLNAAQWSSQGSTQNRAEKVSKRKNKLERQGFALFAATRTNPKTSYLNPGVYARQRTGGLNTIKPLLLFVNRVTYQKRLDWYGVAQRTAERELPAAMQAAVARAIETAR